jgi:Fe2+-dicitrate sensor, membrane component
MEKQSLERAKQFALWEAQTKPGQQVTLNFADGTKVVLNSASQLKYSISSQGVREVYLQGEAYFEVVHSDAQPFILHVVDGTIRDIGTKFDVKAWPDDERTRLAVIEGMISVQPNGRTQENILVRGHQYCVIGKGGVMVPPSYTNVSRDIQWLDGKQAFHNEAMSDVVRQIWRIYGIHCFVSDTSILSKRITTSFDNRDPAKRVLDIIALSLNLKYKIWKDSVLFVPSEPLLRESKRINNTKDASYEKGEVHQ